MLERKMTAVISVSTAEGCLVFSAEDREKPEAVAHYTVAGGLWPLEPGFYERMDAALGYIRSQLPETDFGRTALILPNALFRMDAARLPTMGKTAMKKSLELTVRSLCKNPAEWDLHTHLLCKNKKQASFYLVGTRREVVSQMYRICRKNGVEIGGISFRSQGLAWGISAQNPEWKRGSFLLLDIWRNCSEFVFMTDGVSLGTYALPFGYEILELDNTAEGRMMFDRIPMPSSASPAQERNSDDVCAMQNPFQVFRAWAEELIAGNPQITEFARPKRILVNLPERFSHLLDGDDPAMLSIGPADSEKLILSGGLWMKPGRCPNIFHTVRRRK